MPNLIAERDVVPELVQDEFTAERVASELRRLVAEGSARSAMIEGFRDIRHRLSAATSNVQASQRAAQAVLAVLERSDVSHVSFS